MTEEEQGERLGSTYLCFRSLFALRDGPLPGVFLLVAESPQSELRATAGRVAGASVLLVLEDGARARRAVQTGAADFLVTSLDEALRILRMEVRRGAALGVCLQAAPAGVLAACVERGVQPDLLDWTGLPAAGGVLEARGARRVSWRGAFEPGERPVLLEPAVLPAAREIVDGERRHWLRHAPAVLGRRDARRVFLPLRAGELERVQAAPDAGEAKLPRV